MATKKAKKLGSGKAKKTVSSRNGHVPKDDHESPRWTFLTNHAHVLTVLDSEPDLVLRQVALRVGITERAVQRIVVDLDESGFIEIEKVGRQNHYKVLKNRSLRHPIEAHRSIGDLLRMIAG